MVCDDIECAAVKIGMQLRHIYHRIRIHHTQSEANEDSPFVAWRCGLGGSLELPPLHAPL